jgi:hypothetical protein
LVAVSVHLKLTVWVGTWYNFNTNNSCGANHASLNWVSIPSSIVMTLASGLFFFFLFISRFTCYWCPLPISTTSSDVSPRCSFCWVAQCLPWEVEFSLFHFLFFYFTFFLRSVGNLNRTIRSLISRITFKLEDCGIWNRVSWYVIEVSFEVATTVLLCLIFLGLPGRWRHQSSSDFSVTYKTALPVLTFVKYVGCFQGSVYQDPAHLCNYSTK